MEIITALEQHLEKYAQEIADLVHQTGPVPYDYQFGNKELLGKVVKRSLRCPNTLYGGDGLHLALEGDELLGILFSFPATQYRKRIAALSPILKEMLSTGEMNREEALGLNERSGHAQWLNPVMRPGKYYILAIAVNPEHRGKQFGVKLIQHAIDLARKSECGALELDVMSDNPAVNFYQSLGLEILAETKAPKPSAYGVPAEYRMSINLK